MSLAERFKTERERLGLTQPRVADLTDVGKTTVINWEKGQSSPTAVQLSVLAEAGLDVLYVVTGERTSAQPAADAAEQVLLDSYRRCNAQARQHLIATAALLAAGVAPAPAPRAKAAATGGGGQSVVGDNAIQIGSVAGKARVKNR